MSLGFQKPYLAGLLFLGIFFLSALPVHAQVSAFQGSITFTSPLSLSSNLNTQTYTAVVDCQNCNDNVQLRVTAVSDSGTRILTALSATYSILNGNNNSNGNNQGPLTIILTQTFKAADIGHTFSFTATLLCTTASPDCGTQHGSFTITP